MKITQHYRRLILASFLVVGFMTFALPHAASAMSASTLVALTNQERQQAGLAPLSVDYRLQSSSAAKAADMFQNDYWAHFSPSGVGPWYFMQQSGYQYVAAGENLAKDFETDADVMTGWMNSPGHRANILNPAYNDIGITVEEGVLQGADTILVVAHYGSTGGAAAAPAPAPAAQPTPTATPAAPQATTAAAPAATPDSSATPAVASTAAVAPKVESAQTTVAKVSAQPHRSFLSRLMAFFSKATGQYSTYYGLSPRRLVSGR